MDDEFKQKLLERLKAIEQRLDTLEADQSQLREAYARSRAHLRRLWLRPPMWTFEQHPPRPLDLSKLPAAPALPKQPPRIAIVTPSFNHGRFLRATIDSVLGQDYPRLFYHVQDGASADETVDILKSYGDTDFLAKRGRRRAIGRHQQGLPRRRLRHHGLPEQRRHVAAGNARLCRQFLRPAAGGRFRLRAPHLHRLCRIRNRPRRFSGA